VKRLSTLVAFAVVGLSADRAVSQTAEDGSQLFTEVTTQRQDRYQHEVFEFTVAVYSRGLTLGREIALVNEETPGLQFRPFRDQGGRREEIEGIVYDVRRFLGRAEAIATGTQTLRPTVRVSVVVPGKSRGAGSRRDRLSPSAEIRQKELHPLPLALRIRPLPEAGRPTAFAGAVGSFAFSASVRPTSVAAGEPVTLAMEIHGSGNIGSLGAPQVFAGDRFRVYDPKLLRREISEDGAGGRLVFEQTLVPRSTTSDSVPAVTFAYFDPALQSYREVVRGPFVLDVRPSSHTAPPIAEAPAGKAVAARPRLPSAIAPLKPEPQVWVASTARLRLGSPWFLALQLVPLAFLVALFFALRRREELARDVPKARRQLAPRAGRTGMAAAEQALREGDTAGFHQALWEALSAYFGHRLNLRPGEISGAAVTGGLADAGLDPRDLVRLGEIFDLLERERFGRPPGAAAPLGAAQQRKLAELLAEVERLIQNCEVKEP
jgi:hypothetical protein